MAKLTRQRIDAIRRLVGTHSDQEIAVQIGVDAKVVRSARRRLGLKKGSPTSAKAGRREMAGEFGFSRRLRGMAATAARCANHRIVVWICFLPILACVFYAAMLPIANQDIGWHLALGRHMVETTSVATTEPLSHTAHGAPMVAHEWLSQVLLYLVSRTIGLLGLRCTHAALTALFVVLLYLLLRRAAVGPALAFAGAFGYFLIAQSRFELRPHVISMFFLAGLYTYLFRIRPALTMRQLAGLFAAVVLWANLHSGVVLFAALVVLYVAVECVQQITGWGQEPEESDLGRGKPRRLVTLAVGVVVGLFLTPNHFRLIPYVLESRRINAASSREWVSITEYWGSPLMKPLAVESFWVLVTATVLVALVTFRRHRFAHLVIVLFVLALPLGSYRFVAASFIPVLFVFDALGRWVAPAHEKTARVSLRPARQAVILASLLVPLLTVYPALGADLARFKNRLSAAWNFRKASFPVGAVDFLDAVDLEGKLFNPSEWGGYILYRTYKKYPVFIDGRWITYGERVFEDSRRIRWRLPGAFEKLDKYDIDILLVPREFITRDLPQRKDWIPVFEHFSSGVYLRNHSRNAENLRECAEYYRRLNIPFDTIEGFNERSAIRVNPQWARRHNVRRQHLDLKMERQVMGW